jgi:hypothetical protein
VPAVPAWLTTPLWDQFAALLPARPAVDPTHPLGCHRGRIPDRIVMKRSSMVDGHGIPLDRVLAGANRHDSPLLAPTLDKLDELGPLPETVTVQLDAGYDSAATRQTLAERRLTGEIAHKGDKAPIQAGQR